MSIETISTQFDVSVGTVHTIIREELKMRKICTKFFPRVVREDQKERRCHDSKEMVELINSDPAVLDALVTCDESWIYCYAPKTKRQSFQWKHAGSPRPKKARQSKSTHKFLMIPFFDSSGTIYMHWVTTGQTVNKEYLLLWTPTHGRAKAGRPARTYIQQLCEDTGCCPEDLPRAMNDREEWRESQGYPCYQRDMMMMRKRFRRKRPALFKSGQWHFQQDNAPVHNSILITDYLTKMGIKTVPHPPYSPDLVTFAYSLSSEAVVMRQLRKWKMLWRRSLTRSHKRTSMGPSRSCWNSTTSALQLEEIISKGARVSCVNYQ